MCALRCIVETIALQRVVVGPKARKILRVLIGALFLFMGAVGALMPVMPGWPFLLVGLGLLSTESRTAHRIDLWLRGRFPRFFSASDCLKGGCLDLCRGSRTLKQIFSEFRGLLTRAKEKERLDRAAALKAKAAKPTPAVPGPGGLPPEGKAPAPN